MMYTHTHTHTHTYTHTYIHTHTYMHTHTHTHTHTASQPSEGGSLEDAAYRCYRKRSGEEALLERKRKQRRIATSLEVFSRKDVRDSNRIHYQFLARLHQQVGPEPRPLCSNPTCEHKCAPFASRCLKRILFDCVCGGGGGGGGVINAFMLPVHLYW